MHGAYMWSRLQHAREMHTLDVIICTKTVPYMSMQSCNWLTLGCVCLGLVVDLCP